MPILWIPLTLVGSAAFTARNSLQRQMSKDLGLLPATFARFIFALPFVFAFAAIALVWSGTALPHLPSVFAAWIILGGSTQILGTLFLLYSMEKASFAAATTYNKLEPIILAFFGYIVLNDRLTQAGAGAIALATTGLLVISWPRGGLTQRDQAYGLLAGVLASSLTAINTVAFRAAATSIDAPFYVCASVTLACVIAFQSSVLIATLALARRQSLRALFVSWRSSVWPGGTGALASQCYFTAYALENAAYVRTLGLLEITFSQLIARTFLKEKPPRRTLIGSAMIGAGVAALLLGKA